MKVKRNNSAFHGVLGTAHSFICGWESDTIAYLAATVFMECSEAARYALPRFGVIFGCEGTTQRSEFDLIDGATVIFPAKNMSIEVWNDEPIPGFSGGNVNVSALISLAPAADWSASWTGPYFSVADGATVNTFLRRQGVRFQRAIACNYRHIADALGGGVPAEQYIRVGNAVAGYSESWQVRDRLPHRLNNFEQPQNTVNYYNNCGTGDIVEAQIQVICGNRSAL